MLDAAQVGEVFTPSSQSIDVHLTVHLIPKKLSLKCVISQVEKKKARGF
jgi:hypothetical protein